MTVREILEKYLKDNGYDGLFNDDGECACELSNLAPCDYNYWNCIPGYKVPCDCEKKHAFHMVATKP